MAIVTGDRYLDRLVSFTRRRAGSLLSGDGGAPVTLKLNPAGLHYVQSRLESLLELEELIAAAPVDYLRAYVSDLGDHRALEQLRRILRLLTSLKVISSLPGVVRDPTPLSLVVFKRLRVLELRGCDLSTSAARGLLELRGTLEKLVCYNSTDALKHVFASRIADIKESPVWNRLRFVSCACNGLVVMDEALRLLPVVETLDLSRNRFARVDNLRLCMKLRYLDMGFNQLRTIGCLSGVSCPIVRLVLRNNALTTLNGLQNLKSLEGLDLSYNIISSFPELEILASLPSLQDLWLEGNPLCCARLYRARVFSFFSHPEKFKLDEQRISTREYWERHFIFAKRQKQPACYGFYFPAKDGAEDEGCIKTKKKKHSRLASIEDDKQRTHLSSDVVSHESVPSDSELLKKDENAVFDGDSEIASLMSKVEYLKKEQPIFWLREFKDWFDQSSKANADVIRPVDSTLGPPEERYMKQGKGQYLGESSTNVSDVEYTSDGGNSSSILAHSRGISEIPVDNGPINRATYEQKVHSRLLQDLSLLDLNGRYNHSLTGEGSSQGNQKTSPVAFTAIDEIIGSRSSSLCPGSPPHYQRDILHRKLYSEEEFLQLSARSLSLPSSDSDTSCSEDDTCRFHLFIPELDPVSTRDFSQGSGDHSDLVHNQDKCHDGREEECLNEDSRISPQSQLEYSSQNQVDLLSPDDILSDHSHEVDRNARQDVGGTEKRRIKRKPKKRIISLVGNTECNTEIKTSSYDGKLDIYKADMDTKWNVGYKDTYACYSSEDATMTESHNWTTKSPNANDGHNSLLKGKSEILIMN